MTSPEKSLWQQLKSICGHTGIGLEFIPIDDQCYEIYARYPDSSYRIAKSDNEDKAIKQAIKWFEDLNKKMNTLQDIRDDPRICTHRK